MTGVGAQAASDLGDLVVDLEAKAIYWRRAHGRTRRGKREHVDGHFVTRGGEGATRASRIDVAKLSDDEIQDIRRSKGRTRSKVADNQTEARDLYKRADKEGKRRGLSTPVEARAERQARATRAEREAKRKPKEGDHQKRIAAYGSELKEALGDSKAFGALHARISGDKNLRNQDLAAVLDAAGIYHRPRATRAALLQTMQQRHETVATVRWKYDFMDGRNAA